MRCAESSRILQDGAGFSIFLSPDLSRSKLSVLTVSVSVSKLTVLTVYRFDRLPFCRFPFWSFCNFGFIVLHFAVSNFTGRFAVLPVAVLPFCRSVSPFCRSRFAVLANSVLIPFTVLTAECLDPDRFAVSVLTVLMLISFYRFENSVFRFENLLRF
mgnify:CR=1 FL=1